MVRMGKDVTTSLKGIHGGDIYRNHVNIDFSVNVNPLGIPEEVKKALYEAIDKCREYPDIEAEKLKNAVSDMLSIRKEYLLFGNGASELFMAIVHAIRPKKTVIPVPSFYGYEHAAGTLSGDIIYYPMREDNLFCLNEDLFSILTGDVDLLFLANPNNPTGNMMSNEYMKKLLCHCRENGIYVVLDECFIEFCDRDASMLSEIERFENLILVRAFTKIFAIPGVRLGYVLCSNKTILSSIKRQLPEWNLSTFAQAAGCACANQSAFIKKTVDIIKEERLFLSENLKSLGFRVFSAEANFIMLYSEQLMYERLLERGILIRNCGNFRGLSQGYYRIAVKGRNENGILIKTIGELS